MCADGAPACDEVPCDGTRRDNRDLFILMRDLALTIGAAVSQRPLETPRIYFLAYLTNVPTLGSHTKGTLSGFPGDLKFGCSSVPNLGKTRVSTYTPFLEHFSNNM